MYHWTTVVAVAICCFVAGFAFGKIKRWRKPRSAQPLPSQGPFRDNAFDRTADSEPEMRTPEYLIYGTALRILQQSGTGFVRKAAEVALNATSLIAHESALRAITLMNYSDTQIERSIAKDALDRADKKNSP